MDDSNDIQLYQNLRNAVWENVDQITRQEAASAGKTVSPEFVASLTDVVFKQMETMATDLEAFAKHGKRSVISMEDVKLCARRNESLHKIISDAATEISNERRKR
ncbi:kinetochore component CENP-S-domain-containing protein [Radiomyces spectabilis]|uniref:kinetochore component CENP-S-domain-containing protein n=1 Tax=Radiomyces spectabilis TaxID=64574 RepID=UPI00221E7DB0|nr:kinetochore component CENP-S-domain-containing protein [Radiomyces spectabilis]KAI8374587.1 kinetochore component CENP-S-domain-containing protein [Radiomyces spectabilis]